MFCARCGQQIPDASVFCQVCGRKATLELNPAAAPGSVEPRPPYGFVTVPQNLGLSGVGGWLLLYCIGTAILLPLAVFGRMRGWQFQNPLYLLEQIRLLYGALVGVFLWMERPIAIYLLRIYFIILAANCLLTFLRLISVAVTSHTAPFRVSGFGSAIWAVAVAIAWLVYFRKSERVRNTYGANI
jgi:hypothetical protein